jgi:hypothetical protein
MEQRSPAEIREGVRSGILSAIAQDFELIGARTVRRLFAAGLVGVAGAMGATLLISGHSFEHHPPWHVLILTTIWAGLLIISLSLIFLRIRTPGLPIAPAATVGVLGLGVAGLCSAICPDGHFLAWWGTTAPGAQVVASGGLLASALCFGLVTSAVFAAASAALVLKGGQGGAWAAILPAMALFLLLEPGVILQSVGTSFGEAIGWTLGTAIGCFAGVSGSMLLRSLFQRRAA